MGLVASCLEALAVVISLDCPGKPSNCKVFSIPASVKGEKDQTSNPLVKCVPVALGYLVEHETFQHQEKKRTTYYIVLLNLYTAYFVMLMCD